MRPVLIPLYKLMALAFFYPEKAYWEKIEKQFALCRDLVAGDLAACLNRFMAHVDTGRDSLENMQSEYLRLFDVGREVSPYETEYLTGKASRKPFALADITGFYRAFGFGLNEGLPFKEAPDHIAIELEFMAILTWKEVFAHENQQAEGLEIVRKARKAFFEEHLARWGFCFCRKVSASRTNGLYGTLSDLLKRVLMEQCDEYALDAACFDLPLTHDGYRGVRDEQLLCESNPDRER